MKYLFAFAVLVAGTAAHCAPITWISTDLYIFGNSAPGTPESAYRSTANPAAGPIALAIAGGDEYVSTSTAASFAATGRELNFSYAGSGAVFKTENYDYPADVGVIMEYVFRLDEPRYVSIFSSGNAGIDNSLAVLGGPAVAIWLAYDVNWQGQLPAGEYVISMFFRDRYWEPGQSFNTSYQLRLAVVPDASSSAALFAGVLMLIGFLRIAVPASARHR